MSSTIKVNLTKVGHPCEQDDTRGRWRLFMSDCHGIFQDALVNRSAMTFHGNRPDANKYRNIPLDFGYAEIKDVPTGRYFLFAMEDEKVVGHEIHSNYISHVAVVDVCCGCKDYCVTLYNPHLHECFSVIYLLFEHLQASNKVDEKAIQALGQVKVTIEKLTGAKIGEQNLGLRGLFENLAKGKA